MSAFTIPDWDSTPTTDKTCDELSKASKKKNRNKHEKVAAGRVKKVKKVKNKKSVKEKLKDWRLDEHKETPAGTALINAEKKVKKKTVTHQTLFCRKPRKKKVQNGLDDNFSKSKEKVKKTKQHELNTPQPAIKTQTNKAAKNQNLKNLKNTFQLKPLDVNSSIKKRRKGRPLQSLRERMLEKLKAARFRSLNEQMYTSKGAESKRYFQKDQEAFQAYHEGYRQQVAQWPLNPLDIIIEKIRKMPQSHIIADFGCGEAKLAQSVSQKVHSFDLVAVNEEVVACDMAHVPLDSASVDVVVFCLSLMGTNLKDYLLEAHRVLKVGGLLKIAEVESRFDSMEDFIRDVQLFGFTKKSKDLSHDLFCFMDFVKKETTVKSKKRPEITLKPCLYKKR